MSVKNSAYSVVYIKKKQHNFPYFNSAYGKYDSLVFSLERKIISYFIMIVNYLIFGFNDITIAGI